MGLGQVWEWFKKPGAGSGQVQVLSCPAPFPVIGNQRALALLHFQTHRRGHEEMNRKGKLAHRSSSFHSGILMTMALQAELRRLKTLPDLLVGVSLAKTTFLGNKKQLTKEQRNISDISLTLRAYPVDCKS
ncbi:hypothetical protein CK203_005450 [Vitis vinifera]|uniref:Uncharacterized protein n=1 Tax=Vitis vinifera TaxID=29760 RepID=A0A438K3U5_VITVI|nr:hypothetical protein CK203_005450 [Vitis vinifera]